MQKTDLRTLDEPVKFELRKRAMALIESGKKKGEVADILVHQQLNYDR